MMKIQNGPKSFILNFQLKFSEEKSSDEKPGFWSYDPNLRMAVLAIIMLLDID